MKIKVRRPTLYGFVFYCTLIYLLMRPFINTYFTESFKYIMVLALVYCAVKCLCNKHTLDEIGGVELLLFFGAWVYVFFSAFLNGGFELLIYTAERYMFYSIPLLVMPIIRKRTDWNGVLKFLGAFGVVDSFVSIAEFVTKKQMFVMGVEQVVQQQWGDNSLRTYGLSGNYFLLAEILCLCGLAVLYLYLTKRKMYYLIEFVIIAIGIFTTGSRGYYVAFFVGVCMMVLMDGMVRGLKTRTLLKGLGIAFFLVLAVLVVFGTTLTTGIDFIDTILSRCRSIVDFSGNKANSTRATIWVKSIAKWQQKPFWGWGAQCTDVRYSKFKSVTESGILKRLVELGIFGTILQYASMLLPLGKGVKRFKSNPYGYRPFIFFISLIFTLSCEDIVLQQYTSMEYTIFIWLALSFILTTKNEDQLGKW